MMSALIKSFLLTIYQIGYLGLTTIKGAEAIAYFII